ncbi:MAG TPA: Gfo/Idh/MocA family oxidoreductase, partial [Pirellulales bacterium]|nr:Gfo/Idh/MocA family oxidoreductase [Pirellulales bacterium]
MSKIRIGIIGTGAMATQHALNFKRQEGVELTSCFDVVEESAEAFAKAQGVLHVADNVAEVLRQVDAVSVVTPDRFHMEPSLAALEAGKHLLCEKPLTVTLDESRRVAAAARQAAARGAIHMVNFTYRRSAAFQEAIELVREGRLGNLRQVRSFYLQSWLVSATWGHWTTPTLLWRLETAAGSGGALSDLGCHILDLTTAIAGPVKQVRAALTTFPKITPDGREVTEWEGHKLDANDLALVELRFANGALGITQASRWAVGHKNHLRFEAAGTKSALRFELEDYPGTYDEIELFEDKKW